MHTNLILQPYLDRKLADNRLLNQLLLISMGVLGLALLARVSIVLPYTPVPITGQTFGVLLLGLLYGRKLGLSTILSYIAVGSLGLPVFSLGKSGLLFFSPSGGYLIGYVCAVYLCGYFAERGWTQSFTKMAVLMLLAECAIYLPGLLQLSYFVPNEVLQAGFYPFVLGDLGKMTLVSLLLPSLWSVLKRHK